MAETAAPVAKKSKTAFIIISSVILIGLVIGAIYLFKQSAQKSTSTTTTSDTKGTSGLSSLLGSINLSGLDLSLI